MDPKQLEKENENLILKISELQAEISALRSNKVPSSYSADYNAHKLIEKIFIDLCDSIHDAGYFERIFSSVQKKIRAVIRIQHLSIVLYDSDTQLTEVAFRWDEEDATMEGVGGQKIPVGQLQTLAAEVIRTMSPITVDHKAYRERFSGEKEQLKGFISGVGMGVPVTINQEVSGALVIRGMIHGPEENATASHILHLVSDHIGMALARVKMKRSLEKHRKMTTLFSEVSQAIHLIDNEQELYEAIFCSLKSVMPMEHLSIAFYNRNLGVIVCPFSTIEKARDKGRYLLSSTQERRLISVMEGKKSALWKGSSSPFCENTEESTLPAASFISADIPFSSGDSTMGVIIAESDSGLRPFDKRDLEILRAVAGQLAYFLDQREIREAFKKRETYLSEISRQAESLASSAISVLSLTDENLVADRICQIITSFSDFRKAALFLSDENHFLKRAIGQHGMDRESVDAISAWDFSITDFPPLLEKGKKIGSCCYDLRYLLSSEKNRGIGNNHSRAERLLSHLHLEDYLFIPLKEDSQALIGILMVKESRSKLPPTDSSVHSIEVLSRLFAPIIRYKLGTKSVEIEKMTAMEVSQEKRDFLNRISHEIRTPMNAIVGMGELLLDTGLDEKQREYATVIQRGAQSLLQIISDILDYAKIESGKMELEIIDFDLRNTIDDITDLFGNRIYKMGLEFAIIFDQDIHSCLRGDPGRLRQILIHLIGNSMKFTKEGEIVVMVDLDGESDKDVTIRFSVMDTGSGVSPDRIDTLFDTFLPADRSMVSTLPGTGLGLAISKQLVEMMGGKIGVESRIGKGSTFWFTAVLEKQEKSCAFLPLSSANIKEKYLLVVDDNRTNRELVGHYLNMWGCRFDVAENAGFAFQLMKDKYHDNDPFHLVITDHMMPEIDGETFGQMIKKDPELKDTILVMLTSIGSQGDVKRLKSIGFSAYLMKPVRQKHLLDSLNACLVNVEDRHALFNKVPFITRHTLKDIKKSHLRFLVVEDNPVNQKLVMHMIEKFGYAGEAVSNGEEALSVLKRSNYDLVLMDVQMPVMDGLTATKRIRDRRSDVLNHNVPVIALTAHAMVGDKERCLEAGMDDYVTKPINAALLLAAIKRFLPEEPSF